MRRRNDCEYITVNEPVAPTASAIAGREAGLHKDLSRAQLVMIGLGGAIGTGLFMGSGLAIGYAGPAVVLSYSIAAIAAVAMVFSLSEMAVMHPTAGSFGTYAEIYLNPWAGMVARYSCLLYTSPSPRDRQKS